MAKYIECEYVLKCMEDSYKNAGISAEAKAKMTRWLKKTPAADVRPVVTCADCKYNTREVNDLFGNSAIQCITGLTHRRDWFCADGKKREES